MSWRDKTCYTYRGLFIPMCLGAAINGKHACTCDRKRAKKDQVDRLEMRVEMIEAICNALDMRPPLPDEKAAAYALMEQMSKPVPRPPTDHD